MSQNAIAEVLPLIDEEPLDGELYATLSSPTIQEPAETQPWSMDSYANNLMDELFEEVDQILEGEAELAPEPIVPPQPSYTYNYGLQPTGMAPRMLSPYGSGLARQPGYPLQSFPTVETIPLSKPLRPPIRWLDTLMVAMAASCLLAAIGMVQANQMGINPLVALMNSGSSQDGSQPSPKPNPKVEAETRFINYVRQSLVALNQTPASPASSPLPVGSLPPVLGATNPGPTAPPTVLDRVYLPVYQSPLTSATAANRLPTLPLPPAAPNALPPISAVPIPQTPAQANTETRTLVGILGSTKPGQSAALFEINGSTQRVYIGEGIGNSGWTLVKVINQEAMVRRNGQVRSLFVGQQF